MRAVYVYIRSNVIMLTIRIYHHNIYKGQEYILVVVVIDPNSLSS